MEIKITDSIKDRFWSNVSVRWPTECWEWTGNLRANGYGRIIIDGREVKAHRLSYLISVGQVGDKHVLHKCDNTRCVNPSHLFLGTHADNMRDAWMKGRLRGPSAPQLIEDVRQQVYKMYLDGATIQEIRQFFGIHRETVKRIVRRLSGCTEPLRRNHKKKSPTPNRCELVSR